MWTGVLTSARVTQQFANQQQHSFHAAELQKDEPTKRKSLMIKMSFVLQIRYRLLITNKIYWLKNAAEFMHMLIDDCVVAVIGERTFTTLKCICCRTATASTGASQTLPGRKCAEAKDNQLVRRNSLKLLSKKKKDYFLAWICFLFFWKQDNNFSMKSKRTVTLASLAFSQHLSFSNILPLKHQRWVWTEWLAVWLAERLPWVGSDNWRDWEKWFLQLQIWLQEQEKENDYSIKPRVCLPYNKGIELRWMHSQSSK